MITTMSSTNMIKTIITIISVGLWCINFFYVHREKPMLFRIAKGFGLNLRCWPPLLYATMLRTLLHGKLEKHIVFHKFIGYVMIICSLGHGIAHMIYLRVDDLVHVTGYLLLSMFILMSIGYSSRNWNYSFFKYTHLLYYIILPMMIVHVTRFWIWFGITLIVFSIELFLNLNKLQYSSIKNIDKQGNHLFVSVPRAIDSVPGSYYYLCVPSMNTITIYGYKLKIPFIGLLEWHPFSLCSSSHINHLTFMIEAKGDWTEELYRIASLEKTLMVVGPFRTSSSLIMNSTFEKKIIVCTGIGITPFLSVINTKIDEYHTNNNYRSDFTNVFERDIEQHRAYNFVSISNKDHNSLTEHSTYKNSSLDIHWTFRDLKKVENFFNYIRKVLMRSNNINLHIYVTVKTDDMEKLAFIEKYKTNGVKSITFGRMNIESFVDVQQVFFCGSPIVRENVKGFCNKNDISFYSEVFE